mgnify:CR=1 FL=1
MSDKNWHLFAHCIRAYRSGNLSRENFCTMWRCAQQVSGFNDYFELLKGEKK